MSSAAPVSSDEELVSALVDAYRAKQHLVSGFLNGVTQVLRDSQELQPHIHSIRSRLKDPTHLRDKLLRKLGEARAAVTPFDVAPENILVRINDLAGVRILHLYTRQMQAIDTALKGIFAEQLYRLVEGPIARTWDDESRAFFSSIGIASEASPTMYTSVHYVVESASLTKVTCEIQVRTLSEEVWGEVDHTINYPHQVGSLACREQIAVLARVTSSATRLVDAIFSTFEDHKKGPSTRSHSIPDTPQ